MDSSRTEAYGRIVRTLADLGPTKLHDAEQDRIRDAADTLVLSVSGDEARAALAAMGELREHLVASGRWSDERAAELGRDLAACGPLAGVA
jgi:hypothetical protein